MNRDIPWEVFQYVLDDESLDRNAFESRMLDDVKLALQVADAVKEMQLLSAALESPCKAEVNLQSMHLDATNGCAQRTSIRHTSVISLGVFAIAACLLLAVIWSGILGEIGVVRKTPALATVGISDVGLEVVANSWVAIESHPDDGSGATSAQVPSDAQHREVDSEFTSDVVAAEDSDWILEAAQQFYQEKLSSGVPG